MAADPGYLLFETYFHSIGINEFDPMPQMISELRQVPGVVAVTWSGTVLDNRRMPSATNPEPPSPGYTAIVFQNSNLREDQRGISVELESGRPIQSASETVIDFYTSRKLGLGIGDQVQAYGHTFNIVGIASVTPETAWDRKFYVMDSSLLPDIMRLLQDSDPEIQEGERFIADMYLQVFVSSIDDLAMAKPKVQAIVGSEDGKWYSSSDYPSSSSPDAAIMIGSVGIMAATPGTVWLRRKKADQGGCAFCTDSGFRFSRRVLPILGTCLQVPSLWKADQSQPQ